MQRKSSRFLAAFKMTICFLRPTKFARTTAPRLCSDNRPLQYSELDTAFVRCMERDTRGLSVKGAAAGLQYLGGFKNDVRVLQGVAGPDARIRGGGIWGNVPGGNAGRCINPRHTVVGGREYGALLKIDDSENDGRKSRQGEHGCSQPHS